MNYFSQTKNLLLSTVRLVLVLGLLSFTVIADAQSVLSGSQTGTIQGMHQGDGFLTISGRDYGFHNDVSLVFYDGEEVGDNFLNEGLVVRFVVNNDGILTRIEVLGPLNLIQALEES